MRIYDLALKDLTQILRDKRSLLFLVAMPIVFTLFMGFALRGGGSKDTRQPLAWVDGEPEARLSKLLFARLDSTGLVKITRMDQASATTALQKEKVDGILVIPAGFTQKAESGETAQIQIIADPASAKGQSLYQIVRAPVSQLMSAVESARLSAQAVGKPGDFEPALESAWSQWEASAGTSLVRMETSAAAKPQSAFGGSSFNQASPGMLVMFAIFGLVASAEVLVQERKLRTLQRLITTAMRPWQIVAGHLLAMFAIVLLQTLLLVVFGQLALKVDYAREPLAVLLVAVSLGLWVASIGLLIGVLAKSDDQVVLFSLLAMFFFSALGGTWFSLEGTSGVFALVGRLMPSAWAMTGFQNILIRGLGLESALLPAGIILAYALVFFLLAVWRFRKLEL